MSPCPSRRLSDGQGEAFAYAAGIAWMGDEAGARRRPTGGSRGSERAGSSPVSNSSPNDTHYHPKEESTTQLQGHRRVAHNRPPSLHPPRPGTANTPSCSRQQGYKRRGPPPAGPPEEQKPLLAPLPEPVARGLARAAAAELGEDPGNLDCWRIAEGLLEGEMSGFDRTAWEKARVGTGRERRWR